MSNVFEIAYWLGYHERILDLAVNVQNVNTKGEGDNTMDQSYYISLPKQLFTNMKVY